jgi:hypothetical protein
MEFLIIVIMIGIGIAVATAQANKRKISDAWNEAASQLRIRHNQGDLFTKRELYGKIKQCHVKVTIRNKSQGNHSAKYTLYDVAYPQPLPFGLSLKEQTAFSGLKKFLGGQDIEVGDPKFDDFVVVKSHDSTQAKRFLHPARRLYVRRILSMHSGAEITDSNVKWDSKGAEGNSGTLVSNVKRLVDFAVNMVSEVEQQNDEPIGTGTDTSSKRLRDDIEAVFTVRDRSEPHIYRIDSGKESVEPIHMEIEERESTDPTDVFDRIEQDIEELLQTDSVTPDAIEVPPENRVELPPTNSPDVHDVCHNLFGAGKISFQINETFKQHYEGMEVQWAGKLMRVDCYPFDLVFGNDPGTKAEFAVAQLEGESHLVKAVLQLPADAHEALSERTGETIVFAGTLMKCDSFMRVLFVGHGRIESR